MKRIKQKIFHCGIVVDNEKIKRETANYKKLSQIVDFRDGTGCRKRYRLTITVSSRK